MTWQRATMTDWVWVQACIIQSMLGYLPANVYAVVLSEASDEWVLKLFSETQLSEALERDLRLMPSEAEGYLQQVHSERHPTESVITTAAVLRPIRTQIVVEERVPIGWMKLAESERLLFRWREAGDTCED